MDTLYTVCIPITDPTLIHNIQTTLTELTADFGTETMAYQAVVQRLDLFHVQGSFVDIQRYYLTLSEQLDSPMIRALFKDKLFQCTFAGPQYGPMSYGPIISHVNIRPFEEMEILMSIIKYAAYKLKGIVTQCKPGEYVFPLLQGAAIETFIPREEPLGVQPLEYLNIITPFGAVYKELRINNR